ncbi:hypothetical protein D3C85_1849190 [compost metagenome]
MGRGDVGAIAQHLHHVADIDHKCTFDQRHVDPLPCSVQHFKPRRSRQQNGEAFVVGVRANARTILRCIL